MWTARVIWPLHLCLENALTLLLPYDVAGVGLAALVAYLQSHVMRRQLIMSLELQRIKVRTGLNPEALTPKALSTSAPLAFG